MGIATITREIDPESLRQSDTLMSDRPTERAPVALQLLGGFRLIVNGHSTQLPESAQRLIAFLALRRHPQTRHCVAGNLWPEKNDDRATANLRSTIWRARLDDGQTILNTQGSLIGLDPCVTMDVSGVESARPDESTATLVSTGSLKLGQLFDELLPGWYDDWVLLERDRLAHIQLRVAESLARALIAQGDAIAATDLAFRALTLDPMGEVKERILSWIV